MSLKAFHIVFVTISVLLALVVGIGSLVHYGSSGESLSLVFGCCWLLAGVGLVFYGRYVLKKLKGMSYL